MPLKKKISNHTQFYLDNAKEVLILISSENINNLVKHLYLLKKRKGRLFLLGVGGSGANCSHAVNDFRKICNIEAYTPVDNVSELTARVNDDGWETTFIEFLKTSKLNKKDIVMVFSVGGGDIKNSISLNIVSALKYAKKIGAKIVGIVGKDGGYTKLVADDIVIIPTKVKSLQTAFTESFQELIWHAIVTHPLLGK